MRYQLRFVLVAALAASGCEKKPAPAADKAAPADLQAPRASFDPSKLVAPALFAHIPADTPYVLAAFEHLPVEYYAKIRDAFAPTFGKLIARQQAEAGGHDLGNVLLDELRGKLNVQGFESLGLSTQPRYAIYGLGLLPVVGRIDIKDEAVLRATIERIATKSGETLPPLEIKDGKAFWRVVKDDNTLIVAIADKQLIAAFGPSALVDAKLGLILGTEKPAQSMADGKLLLDAMARHGFGPHMIGVVDTRKLAALGLAHAGQAPTPECLAVADRVAVKVPRIVFGYGEISTKRIVGGFTLELAPDALAAVTALKTEVPGYTSALAGEPLLAMAAGVDLVKGAGLFARAASELQAIGDSCHVAGLSEVAGGAASSLGGALPPPLHQVTGLAVALHELELGQSGVGKLDAFAMVTATSGKQLFAMLKGMLPLDQLGVQDNGKLGKVTLPTSAIPGEVVAGVGDKALVVATGAKGRSLAERNLRGTAGERPPLLVASYDYGRFVALQHRVQAMLGAQDPDAERMANEVVASMLGRAIYTVDTNDKGIAAWYVVNVK